MKVTTTKKKAVQAPRRPYDEVFRRHAVELTLLPGRRVAEVAGELGVSEGQLYAWRRQYAPRPAGSGIRPRTLEEAEAEIDGLCAEIVQLREREQILKRSLGILSETPARGLPKSKR
jgi:transposase